MTPPICEQTKHCGEFWKNVLYHHEMYFILRTQNVLHSGKQTKCNFTLDQLSAAWSIGINNLHSLWVQRCRGLSTGSETPDINKGWKSAFHASYRQEHLWSRYSSRDTPPPPLTFRFLPRFALILGVTKNSGKSADPRKISLLVSTVDE